LKQLIGYQHQKEKVHWLMPREKMMYLVTIFCKKECPSTCSQASSITCARRPAFLHILVTAITGKERISLETKFDSSRKQIGRLAS
jgi:hypothetical protein